MSDETDTDTPVAKKKRAKKSSAKKTAKKRVAKAGTNGAKKTRKRATHRNNVIAVRAYEKALLSLAAQTKTVARLRKAL